VLATYIAGRSINGDIGQTAQEGRVRPPIRDPLQRRRKDVLLRAEEDVIRAADALARRVGVSRNEALNAMLRAFVQDETDPALRLAGRTGSSTRPGSRQPGGERRCRRGRGRAGPRPA
jgi:hypothetical protein